MTVASIIGFITLFGIATRNGIMLISHIRHLMEASRTQRKAGLALIPIALGRGEPGSEIHVPMAFVILFGLLTLDLPQHVRSGPPSQRREEL